mmetsp:Transcript_22873/g.64258  ORF Transcript_22873/g.64258 Transcript_22873/m.64258 type:complete len:263 (+) Transcript_22873:47-835(+)
MMLNPNGPWSAHLVNWLADLPELMPRRDLPSAPWPGGRSPVGCVSDAATTQSGPFNEWCGKTVCKARQLCPGGSAGAFTKRFRLFHISRALCWGSSSVVWSAKQCRRRISPSPRMRPMEMCAEIRSLRICSDANTAGNCAPASENTSGTSRSMDHWAANSSARAYSSGMLWRADSSKNCCGVKVRSLQVSRKDSHWAGRWSIPNSSPQYNTSFTFRAVTSPSTPSTPRRNFSKAPNDAAEASGRLTSRKVGSLAIRSAHPGE